MRCWALIAGTILVGLSAATVCRPCSAAPQQDAEHDKIVDDFIQYDIGQLPGQAGRDAVQRFAALQGNEAIRALCRGANKAARLSASCPIIMVANKLQQLLAKCQDEETLRYVMDSLDVNATDLHYGDWLRNLRGAAAAKLGRRDRELDAAGAVLRGGGTVAELRLRRMARKPLATWDYEDLVQAVTVFKGTALVQILEEMSNRKGSEYTDALADAIAKVPEDVKPAVRGLLANRLTRMTDDTLRAKLTDPSAEVRAAAAVGVGYKGAPLYKELAAALRDRSLLVATSAHEVLVKMLGVDHGPAAGASGSEWYAASKAWEEWIEKNHPDKPPAVNQ